MTDQSDAIRRILEIENFIEDALWTSVQDEDYARATKEHRK
jgi:hypothetical protein